jgi:nitrile hydratase accessory protein
MAVALHAAGAFTWDRFQAALIARIAEWEATHEPGTAWSYYRCWLAALEDVLAAAGAVSPADVTTMAEVLAARPAGHDHAHPHPH